MTLVLVGTSHRLAPVEVRERVAFGEKEAAEVARSLAADGWEAVCLSTCNRTELYLAAEDADGGRAARRIGSPRASGALPSVRPRRRAPSLPRRRGPRFARPRRGGDSRPGAKGGRARRARPAARAALPGCGPRRAQGALADRDLGEPRFDLLGRGRAGAAGVRRPGGSQDPRHRRGQDQRAGRAEPRLARRGDLGGGQPQSRASARSWPAGSTHAPSRSTRRRRSWREADVVVSSTSAGGFVLEQAGVQATLGARRGRPLFLIDLAVPRDLDPAIHELPGCYLYDIDDLQAVVAESLAGRRSEAARAEEIVAAEAERFRAWQASLDVVPAIASLRARAEEIRVERARARPAERAVGAGSPGRRVADRSDRQQAAPPADRADEGGGGRC